jgi:hypothetical protein
MIYPYTEREGFDIYLVEGENSRHVISRIDALAEHVEYTLLVGEANNVSIVFKVPEIVEMLPVYDVPTGKLLGMAHGDREKAIVTLTVSAKAEGTIQIRVGEKNNYSKINEVTINAVSQLPE